MSVLPISTNRPPARQQPQRGVHELARAASSARRPRPAARRLRNRSRELQDRARRRCAPRRSPSAAQHAPLARARRREHLDAQLPGELHRRHPHAARRGVHQQPLARPQPRQVDAARSRRSGRRSAPTPPARTTTPAGSARAAADRPPRPARTRRPAAPSRDRPARRSSTPGPTSSTTPAPSPPIAASPGYIPSAISTSRKFTPAARTATRTSPAPSAPPARALTNARSSSVPPLPLPKCRELSPGGRPQRLPTVQPHQPRHEYPAAAHHQLRLPNIQQTQPVDTASRT